MTRIARRTFCLLLLFVSATTLLACRAGSSNNGAAKTTPATVAAGGMPAARSIYPLTLPSSDGRSLTLARAPERIVSLSPGHTEILFAIGAGETLVGTDRFSDFPEAVKALPKIDYSNPNLEALVALRPDLVIAAQRQRTLVPAFEQAGLKVLLMEEPGSVAGVLERVRLLGQVTDRIPHAEELAARLQERVTSVTEKVKEITAGPRVYHEIDPKLYSAAPNSFVGNLYLLLRAQNIAQSGTSHFPQLTAEAIIQADPEVIVLGDGLFPGGTPDEVKRRAGWSVISAVKSNRVYPVEDNLVSRPSPRVVDGLEQVAKLLYPELFR